MTNNQKLITISLIVSLSCHQVALANVPIEAEKCPTGLAFCTETNFSVDQTKKNILSIVENVLTYAALIAVIMLIVAGIRLIVAMGNQESLQSARKHIIWLAAGFFLIILALLIVKNVLDIVYETTIPPPS